MFDPATYFDSLRRALSGCETWAEIARPAERIESDRYGKWSWCTWRIEIAFADGTKLEAFESHSMRRRKHLRKIKYRLTAANGELIAQIDTHGRLSPFDEAPHIHIGPNQSNRVYEGDSKLKGYSLKDYDFLKMWELVERYINGEGLPWRG